MKVKFHPFAVVPSENGKWYNVENRSSNPPLVVEKDITNYSDAMFLAKTYWLRWVGVDDYIQQK